jgi:hypothetical protein
VARQKQARRYGRKVGGSVAFTEADGPPCDHGPECEVRSLWHLDGETDDEFVARLKFSFGGLETPA